MSQFPTIEGNSGKGGHIKIVLYDPKGGIYNVGGGAKNLNQSEMQAYKIAKVKVANGEYQNAVRVLENAGFEVASSF